MAMAKRIREEVGEVTILVNNAGIMPCRPVLDLSEEEVRSMIDINFAGNIWVSHFHINTPYSSTGDNI